MRTLALALLLIGACSSTSQDVGRAERYRVAEEWCATLSRDGIERVLWVCHDDAPLVVVCTPVDAVDPCVTVMVQP